DGTREPSSRSRGVGHAARLLAASIQAQVALRSARGDLEALLREARLDAPLTHRRVLFLNTNLWFGVRAGGSIAHVAGVANALVERGYELELATAPEPVGVRKEASVRRLIPPRSYGLPVESNLYRLGRAVP